MIAQDHERRATLVANERAKLTATFVNTLAAAVMVVGAAGAGCVVLSGARHPTARAIPGSLRP